MMRNKEATKCYNCRQIVEAGEGYVSRTHNWTSTVVHIVCPKRQAATKPAEARAAEAPAVEVVEAVATPAAPAVPMATDRQVSYALSLAARNAEGSLDVTTDTLRRMTRREISSLIDSLKSEW